MGSPRRGGRAAPRCMRRAVGEAPGGSGRRLNEHPSLGCPSAAGRSASRRARGRPSRPAPRVRVARADEHEPQLPAPLLGVGSASAASSRGARGCAARSVREVLEAERVLAEAGDRERARDRAERDEEVLAAEPVLGALRLDEHRARLVEPRPVADDQLRLRRDCRSGTTTWRGSIVPEAASARSGREHVVLGVDDRALADAPRPRSRRSRRRPREPAPANLYSAMRLSSRGGRVRVRGVTSFAAGARVRSVSPACPGPRDRPARSERLRQDDAHARDRRRPAGRPGTVRCSDSRRRPRCGGGSGT